MDICVEESGEIHFEKFKALLYMFLDWPSYGSANALEGVIALLKVCLHDAKEIYKIIGEDSDLCDKILKKLPEAKDSELKSVTAMQVWAGDLNAADAAPKLAEGNAKNFSVFMSSYILKAMAQGGMTKKALEIMCEYFGGMLSRGATTFWEEFDVEWLKGSGRIDELPCGGLKDLPGDYGAECYLGLRHSLCHGWSAGVVSFLTEYICGIHIEGSGCRKILLKPELCGMKWLKGKYPTPYGIIEFEYTLDGGKVKTKYKAPPEIEIIAE